MNNKGFMHIKLLSIIFIVCIICFTLIPNLVVYYTNNKKDKYIEVAKECIEVVKESIDSLEYVQIPKENQALAVQISSLGLKAKSPYGVFKNDYSYVIVLNVGDYYDYYFASIDSSNRGIPIVKEKELNRDSIVYGLDKLAAINKFSSIENLYVSNTLFEKSDSGKDNDKNVLLTPVSGELSVPYDFKSNVHKIYNSLIKSIDTNVFNKEATINNGVLKYNNEVISSNYSKDINGFFRYLSFPDKDELKYYSGFVSYNKSYVAGIINESNDYEDSNIVFDSRPTIVLNKSASLVEDEGEKYVMWNLMSIYPDNSNYTISECGAIIVKSNTSVSTNITFDTPSIMVGRANNNCEVGNIFAIRKDNVYENDRFFARGYIKYKDKNGDEHIAYSRDTVSALVKE